MGQCSRFDGNLGLVHPVHRRWQGCALPMVVLRAVAATGHGARRPRREAPYLWFCRKARRDRGCRTASLRDCRQRLPGRVERTAGELYMIFMLTQRSESPWRRSGRVNCQGWRELRRRTQAQRHRPILPPPRGDPGGASGSRGDAIAVQRPVTSVQLGCGIPWRM